MNIWPEKPDVDALYECCMIYAEALADIYAISENHKHLPVMLHLRRIADRANEDVYQIAKKEDEGS